MYARSTTIHGNAAALDDAIACVRDEIMPALERMSGCVGVSMLADRTSGRCIVTSAWADDTAMHATEQEARELRDRVAGVLGGAWEAQIWEIVLMHRAHDGHDGCRTRVVWAASDPARVEENLAIWQTTVLPRLKEIPGFCSVSLMGDRATGRSALATTYDSAADMDRATETGTAMREDFRHRADLEVIDVAEFDLVLHHLRVPQTV